jgi:hypothetical protein
LTAFNKVGITSEFLGIKKFIIRSCIIYRSQIPQNFEIWCWRRMEKISWADHVKNGHILQRVQEERNVLHTIKRRKAN